MSDAMICNDFGVDVDDVYQQFVQEMALREEYSLPEPQVMGAAGGGPQALIDLDDETDAEEEA